jgi:peroxiredoxin
VHIVRVSLATAAVVLAFTGCNSSPRAMKAPFEDRDSPAAASVKPQKARKAAPDFALKDANGQIVHLSDYRGKVVLLDFWATWCGPCKVEIPWFQEFERQNKDKGFAVLGVAMDEEGWQVVKPFAQYMKINYRLLAGDEKTADLYGRFTGCSSQGGVQCDMEALPTTFLIDREGKIAAVHVGLSGKRDFEDGIQELL